MGPAIRVFWNPGEGLTDLLEVLRNYSARVGRARYEELQAQADDWFVQRLQRLLSTAPPPSFESHIDRFQSVLSAETARRHPILVVAHSQGNMLVNRAFQRFIAQNPERADAVAVVGVAVADHFQPSTGWYRYVTSNRDKVFDLLPFALDRNFTVSDLGAAYDPLIHGFVSTYLSESMQGYYRNGPTARSLRSVVTDLVKDGLAYVDCSETSTVVQAHTTPAIAGVPIALTAIATPISGAAGRTVVGTMTFVDGTGNTLCAAPVNSPSGMGTCNATIGGAPRTETITARFAGTSRFGDSQSAASALTIESAGMVGTDVTISRRYPSAEAPATDWSPPTITIRVQQGNLDEYSWQAGSPLQRYARVNPESRRITFLLDQSRYLGAGEIFDGFAIRGFPLQVRRVSASAGPDLSVTATLINNEVFLNIVGDMRDMATMVVDFEFDE